MLPSTGDRLGPYEITDCVGAGGMSVVFRARDTRLDRTVAIQILQRQFGERFEREARSIATLNHANICRLYDVGPNYLVMEFIDGTPIPCGAGFRKTLDTAVQIAAGLAAAHAAGIVHRDLKPDNILMGAGGCVKILDFSLAKQAVRPGTGPVFARPGSVRNGGRRPGPRSLNQRKDRRHEQSPPTP